MAASRADKARLAHRVLRLREAGVTGERDVLDRLAEVAPPSENGIGGDGVNPLARLAQSVSWATDEEKPGPTDPEYVEQLLGMSRAELIEEWDREGTAHLEEVAPDDLRAARAAQEEQRLAVEEENERMGFTGQWPSGDPAVPHERAAREQRIG